MKAVNEKINVKKAGERVAVLGKVSWRKIPKEPFFFSAKLEQHCASNGRLELRETLVPMWSVDTHRALRMCDCRQVEVSAYSYVFLGKG